MLSDLTDLSKSIAQASVDGDITFIAKNITDEFELTTVDGKQQNKNEALADVKKERTIRSFSYSDEELTSFSDDSATLNYTLTVRLRSGQSGKAKVTENYVKKNGQWMMKSEQQTLIRK